MAQRIKVIRLLIFPYFCLGHWTRRCRCLKHWKADSPLECQCEGVRFIPGLRIQDVCGTQPGHATTWVMSSTPNNGGNKSATWAERIILCSLQPEAAMFWLLGGEVGAILQFPEGGESYPVVWIKQCQEASQFKIALSLPSEILLPELFFRFKILKAP